MGMEYLLGKGHMVFPERFLHVMHQMETSHSICTKRLADKAREREKREVRFHLGVHFTCRRGAYSQFSRRRGHGFPVPWCRFPMGVCNCHTHRLRFWGMSIVIIIFALSLLCVDDGKEGTLCMYVSLAWRVESLGEKQLKGQGMYCLPY